MVLSTEWSQVEVIDLVNDGSGLGFGIVGGRSTGVVIKSILPGGIADRDGRLQSGDHILQVGDVQTRGLASEHVATILRQCGVQVRVVVARPVEPTSCDYRALGSDAPIVPTKTLTDPDELETLLMQNGYTENMNTTTSSTSYEETSNSVACEQQQYMKTKTHVIDTISYPAVITTTTSNNEISDQNHCESETPESETIHVHLKKNAYGLGITVAGYVWEREDLSGIFVKGISEGSAAHLSGQIHLNDRIVDVDHQSLRGVTNHEAVEMLRHTGSTVDLVLERYLRGPRYEHLQNALEVDHHHNDDGNHHHHHHQQIITTQSTIPFNHHRDHGNNKIINVNSSPSITTLSWFHVQTDDVDTEIEGEAESHTTIDSTVFEPNTDGDADTIEVFVDSHFESDDLMTPDLDMIVKKRWNSLIGDDTEIIVAQLRKLRGLGISLEGTVDVEDGIELHPRHFIRSILPEGPVGRNGKLHIGDELLEVNGQKLLGRNHVDVVKILKELPETVRIVCARNQCDVSSRSIINTSQDRQGFAARNLLSGSLRTLLNVDDNDNDQQQQQQQHNNDDDDDDDKLSLNNTSSTATLADHDNDVGETTVALNIDIDGDGIIPNTIFNNDDSSIIIIHDNHTSINDKNEQKTMNDEHKYTTCTSNIIDDNDDDDDNDIKITSTIAVHLEKHDDDDDDDNDNIIIDENEEEFKKDIGDEKVFDNDNKTTTTYNNCNNKYKYINNIELLSPSPPKLTKMDHHHHHQSQSIETTVTYLAIWRTNIEYIELYKGNKGLGFSILDYQDPLDPNGTVIVVRSLVPNGCAELDGRIRPGDRIMSVNNISLKNVCLDDAVKALKGAPIGQVTIGFSKPMPLTQIVDDDPTSTTICCNNSNSSGGGGDGDGDGPSFHNIQDNYFIW